MIIRLRSRDGLERLQVPDNLSVGGLKAAINEQLGVSLEGIVLSQDSRLLTSKDGGVTFLDLSEDSAQLGEVGVHHGDMVYLLYQCERVVPGPKRSEFETRPFGAHMDVAKMVAGQTRIERPDAPVCASVSFDRHAANAFQSYVSSAMAFSIKRGGILYGVVDEGRNVLVHAIYEPPQQGSPDSLALERGTEEEARADALAAKLGWTKVGWIFAQSKKERDFIASGEEVCQMAAWQDEVGECGVTALVAVYPGEDEQQEVHFEAFQVSEQCVRLWREGWFQPEAEPSGMSTLRNPRDPKDAAPVIVAGKDVGEVDNDYFLIPVGIRDHEGPLAAAFPVENRLLPQGKAELRAALQRGPAGQAYAARLADFHLLLFLARQPNFEPADLDAILNVVKECWEMPEGYKMIIDSLAGI